jgi:hypothetical protein
MLGGHVSENLAASRRLLLQSGFGVAQRMADWGYAYGIPGYSLTAVSRMTGGP